jgi:hypothetical protein
MVDSRDEDGPNDANNPSTQSRCRHRPSDRPCWQLRTGLRRMETHPIQSRVKVGVVNIDDLRVP